MIQSGAPWNSILETRSRTGNFAVDNGTRVEEFLMFCFVGEMFYSNIIFLLFTSPSRTLIRNAFAN